MPNFNIFDGDKGDRLFKLKLMIKPKNVHHFSMKYVIELTEEALTDLKYLFTLKMIAPPTPIKIDRFYNFQLLCFYYVFVLGCTSFNHNLLI